MLGEHRNQHESSPVIFDESRTGLRAARWPWPAYALALQILLASALAAGMTMTPAADGVVCYGSGNTNSGSQQPSHSPAGFADCALACAQGLSTAAILPPGLSPVPVFGFGRQLEPALAADFILSPRPSPKLAQGPPQNA